MSLRVERVFVDRELTNLHGRSPQSEEELVQAIWLEWIRRRHEVARFARMSLGRELSVPEHMWTWRVHLVGPITHYRISCAIVPHVIEVSGSSLCQHREQFRRAYPDACAQMDFFCKQTLLEWWSRQR